MPPPSHRVKSRLQRSVLPQSACRFPCFIHRALLWLVSLPAARSGLVAHGVVIDDLMSHDNSPFAPDNVRPILNSSAAEPPPSFTDEAWPEKIPTLVSLGRDKSLNLITGQFFTATSGNPALIAASS